MDDRAKITRIELLSSTLQELTDLQLDMVDEVVTQFRNPYIFIENTSDFVDDCLLENFGDVLRIHHCFSKETFTKDKFEFALEKACNLCGKAATLAPTGNPGHDITIDDIRYSLKTQGNRDIRIDKLHISKFMELGGGTWTDKLADFIGLRDQFFHHMLSYDKILSLRCLSTTSQRARNYWHYELVEIPKQLLVEAENGVFDIRKGGKYESKSGYCRVTDKNGILKFQLYFDGGGERKLQIQHILKKECVVHANWIFST